MSKINRTIIDILDWIRRYLWFTNRDATVKRPFETVRKLEKPLGTLQLVVGRDTPRAVRTWVLSPKDGTNAYLNRRKAPVDFHFYLDHSGKLVKSPEEASDEALEEAKRNALRRRGQKFATHEITILRASHFLNPDGFYDYDFLYSDQFDFKKPLTATNPAIHARIAIDRIALLASWYPIPDLTWADEVEEIYRQVMNLECINRHTRASRVWRHNRN